MVDGSANLRSGFIVRQGAFIDLKTGFFALPYRTPNRIKQKSLVDPDSGLPIGIDKDWGGIICIDPNGIRPTGPKGPIFILLDTIDIRPGITDTNGVFVASINDNKNLRMGRIYSKTLFASELFIRDNDEFWIGVQQGPGVPNNWRGINRTWDPVNGGREWLLGGFVTKRYWGEERGRRCTAYVEGKCYMDVWRDQPFGTPTQPRNYETDTDFTTVASNILSDVNALQNADYQFSASTSYWPGVGAIPFLTNISIVREFKNDTAFAIMRKYCVEGSWEWRIAINPAGATPAARRAVMLYPRSVLAPLAPQYEIKYDQNIREIPKILKGDTSELITDVIITDGEVSMVPPDKMMWIQQGLWPDLSFRNREYTMLSIPPPPNARLGLLADASLIIDDEGYPAINFQKDSVDYFNLYLSFYTDETGEPISAQMQLDLRKWRRIRFKFRHPSKDIGDVLSLYRIKLHSLGSGGVDRFNRYISYDFGKGLLSPQIIEGVTDHDAISDRTWSEIDLLAPDVNPDGTYGDMHGWEFHYESDPPNRTADPMAIDFVGFYVDCSESLPGINYSLPGDLAGRRFAGRVELIKNLPQGARFAFAWYPDDLLGEITSNPAFVASGEKVFYNPQPKGLIHGRPLWPLGIPDPTRWATEPVQVDAIRKYVDPTETDPNNEKWPQSDNLPGYFGPPWNEPWPVGQNYPCNLAFKAPLLDSYHAVTSRIYILGGWSMCFSQLRFERNVRLDQAATGTDPQLQNPRRFRFVTAKEIEYLNEAEDLASGILENLCRAQQGITPILDGDPRTKIGMRMVPYLDPGRGAVFHAGLYMFVDEIQYTVESVDFLMRADLGTLGSRTMRIDENAVFDRQERRLTALSQGKTPLTRGVK